MAEIIPAGGRKRKGELIVPIADKRIMEPPDDPHNEVAYMHYFWLVTSSYSWPA